LKQEWAKTVEKHANWLEIAERMNEKNDRRLREIKMMWSAMYNTGSAEDFASNVSAQDQDRRLGNREIGEHVGNDDPLIGQLDEKYGDNKWCQ